MKNLFFILLGVLMLHSTNIAAQCSQVYYSVDSSIVSYRVLHGNRVPIAKGDMISLFDSVNVRSENNFHGHLRLVSPQGAKFDIISPMGPCTLKYALSGKLITNIKKSTIGFIKGLIDPITISSAALRHLWGGENNIADGLSVEFLCKSKSYTSFKSIPTETPFSIVLTNTSDSIIVYSVVFQYRDKESSPYQSIIVDTQTDGGPIVLVPGDSIALPIGFVRPQGYLDFFLNVFGGTGFYLLQINPSASETVSAVSDTEGIIVNRFYFESDE